MAHQSSSYIYNFQDDPLAQSYIDPGYLPFAAPAAFSTPFDPSSSTPLDPVQSATYWGSHDEPQLPRFDYPISPVAAPAPASWTTVTGQAEAPHSQSSQKVTVAQALENVARMSTAVQANLVPAEVRSPASFHVAPVRHRQVGCSISLRELTPKAPHHLFTPCRLLPSSTDARKDFSPDCSTVVYYQALHLEAVAARELAGRVSRNLLTIVRSGELTRLSLLLSLQVSRLHRLGVSRPSFDTEAWEYEG